MAAPTLPPFDTLADEAALSHALSLLFEPSPALLSKLVPEIHARITTVTSYDTLIDSALSTILSWPTSDQSSFISGHPRIGEVRNLSALSASEQARQATPPEVLGRLALLNALYEKRYPGLRYITFVNGRSRAEIAVEMEDKLGLEHSLDGANPDRESIEPVEDKMMWEAELRRAVEDVGKIAKSRLNVLT